MSKKIFVVGGANHYANWIKDHELVHDVKSADIVFFTVGEDVDPSIYGCKNLNAYSNIARDIEEKAIFEEAVKNKTKLILGVCRGLN